VYKNGYLHLDLQHLQVDVAILVIDQINNTKTSDINENEQDDLGVACLM
jgi:hypothetical protein